MSEKKNLLPPGWDCKYDESSGKCYYVNYLTRAMQLQDPRIGYMQLQNDSTESIPLQPMHGSPYHVYPVNNFTAVRAFQGPHSSVQSISGSPLMSTASQMTMETPLLRTQDSPHISRFDSIGSNRRKSIPMQETSFTNQIDTNAVVSKMQTMFPTAGENHIRLLLKKYYNREAVVVSALQVEKHPLCTPGPFATPPIQRHLFNQSNSAFQLTPPTRRLDYYSRSGSPMPNSSNFRPSNIKNGFIEHLYGSPKIGEQIRNSPKPHSSPKMKLRYMKNIFPKADETLLLDILANSDNNVQKASEKLTAMGYVKRDVPIMPNLQKIESDKKFKNNKIIAEKIIPLHPKELTEEEKQNIKTNLQEKYPKITERIVSMALESVSYSEDRANQILQIVQQEDDDRAKKEATAKDAHNITANDIVTGNVSIKESLKEPIDIGKHQPDNIIEKNQNEKSKKNMNDNTQLPQQENLKSQAKSSHKKKNNSNNTNNILSQNVKMENILINNNNKNLNNNNNNNDTKELHISNSRNDIININYEEKTEVDNKSSNDMNCVTEDSTNQQNQQQMSGSTSSSSAVSSTFLSSNAKGPKYVLKYRTRDKSGSLKNSSSSSNDVEKDVVYQQEFQSILGRIATLGHNKELTNGPNEKLLLVDYVTWSGANPNLAIMKRTKTKGSDTSNLKSERATPHGSNSDLCKGPKLGLAKGSIYSNLNANIKCN